MLGLRRLKNVRQAIMSVLANRVPGHFAEFGVWRGGACIFAKAVLNVYGEEARHVHLFDAFEMISGYGEASSYLATTAEAVHASFENYGLLDERVHFHKGFFDQSAPAFHDSFPDEKIAVLRVDCNYYDSYQSVIYSLWDHVPVGGIIIFDDYGSHQWVQVPTTPLGSSPATILPTLPVSCAGARPMTHSSP